MSILYIVATPIGNLDDITLRALSTFKNVNIIACEDTRITGTLLAHHGITGKKLITLAAHNEINSTKGIIKLLEEGNDVALCTDRGTPGISDPGARLVEEAYNRGIKVIPIPGVSATTTLISVAGNIGKTWMFEGFLPKTAGKLTRRLEELMSFPCSFVIYESPFRILKTLGAISEIDKNRMIVVGRELTKLHEEVIKGTAEEIYNEFAKRDAIKGEFAVIVCPNTPQRQDDKFNQEIC